MYILLLHNINIWNCVQLSKTSLYSPSSYVVIILQIFLRVDKMPMFLFCLSPQNLMAKYTKQLDSIFFALQTKNPAIADEVSVVWGGIEPPTQGFSVLCSTDWATAPFISGLFRPRRIPHCPFPFGAANIGAKHKLQKTYCSFLSGGPGFNETPA